jgi:NADH:ubiquinone oxidoreductase subunit 5 (subunit L)/multisubunit Na+/H+ antiporter MnhA subunit
MWVPLAVLAVLAIVGGLVGIGPAFSGITGSEHPGGRFHIVNWLDPVIWNPATGKFGKEHAASANEHAESGRQTSESGTLIASTVAFAPEETAGAKHDETGTARSEAGTHGEPARGELGEKVTHSPYGDTGFNLAHEAEHTLGSHMAAEWLFIIISLAVAGFGILLGFLFYVWRPAWPALWAARLRPLYHLSYNKYWIDELYGALFTRRTMDASRAVYAADSKGIDGAVNGTAWLTRSLARLTGNTDRYVVDGLVNTVAGFITRLMSPLIRAAQTGLIQNYALVMVLGLVVAVLLLFASDIMGAVLRK